MIERRTLSVSLTPELHAFISAPVEDGSYVNSSEVVRAGLRLLCRVNERAAAPRRPRSDVKEPQSFKR